MQIGGLSQCFNRQKAEKIGLKRIVANITPLTSMDYEYRSFLAYLRPTLVLVANTRVMRGAL